MQDVVEIQRDYDVNWEWVAVYIDGSELKEDFYSITPKNYGDIDHNKLKELWLVPSGSSEKAFGVNLIDGTFNIYGVTIHTDLPEGPRRLINFKRVQQQFGPDAMPPWCKHGIGFQVTKDEVNYQQFLFIDPDGKITISNKK